jgi:toxin ParE1/3/4
VDFRLQYTQRALNDFAEIIGYIAGDDSAAASRFGSNLLDHLDLLARFPRMGLPIPKRPQVRKLFHSPILVYYRIHDSKGLIEVLHLRHAARKPLKSFE